MAAAVVGFSDLPTETLDEIARRVGPLDNVTCVLIEEIRTHAWFGLDDPIIHKAVLAPGRRLGTYAVMLLHNDGRRLSYLRPGAKLWTMLRLPRSLPHKYIDVIFHKGAFFTVSCYAEVNAWVPNGKGGLRTRRLTDPRREQVWAALVESASRDDLLMGSCSAEKQHRCYYCYYEQRRYQVSRCDERERVWVPVPAQDIGETAILIGRTHFRELDVAVDSRELEAD